MRLLGRRDRWLVVGLVIAAVVIFSRPIFRLLDVAREVEQSYGLDLIPGLIILLVVFVCHLQGKRQAQRSRRASLRRRRARDGRPPHARGAARQRHEVPVRRGGVPGAAAGDTARQRV